MAIIDSRIRKTRPLCFLASSFCLFVFFSLKCVLCFSKKRFHLAPEVYLRQLAASNESSDLGDVGERWKTPAIYDWETFLKIKLAQKRK